jgi:hypothetical protein
MIALKSSWFSQNLAAKLSMNELFLICIFYLSVTRNLLSCTVVLSIVNIVASILLIVGTVQEKKDFLLGWMIVTVII